MTLVIVKALALGVIGGVVGIGLAQATVGSMAQLPFMGSSSATSPGCRCHA